MSEPPDNNLDLKRLVESLKTTGSYVREWARRVADSNGGEVRLLSRQLDRAAQFLDQAVRALRTPDSSAPPERKGIPGLTGETRAIPLSSLVSFLAEIDATGVLRVYTADENYVLQFESGYLIYAFGDNPPEGMRLGEVLVSQGAIHRADLLRVLDQGWSANETLGGLLVSGEYVTSEELQAALGTQIQELGNRLFSHEDARFRFYADECVIERQDVRINTMGLLLDSARSRDEAMREAEPVLPPMFDLA